MFADKQAKQLADQNQPHNPWDSNSCWMLLLELHFYKLASEQPDGGNAVILIITDSIVECFVSSFKELALQVMNPWWPKIKDVAPWLRSYKSQLLTILFLFSSFPYLQPGIIVAPISLSSYESHMVRKQEKSSVGVVLILSTWNL